MIQNDEKVIWRRFPVLFATAMFCCILWGSATPSIKIAYRLFQIGSEDTASRIMLAGARFVIAGCMTIVLGSVISRKILIPRKTAIGKIAALSVFQTIGQYFFFYMALAHTTGVRGAIISASGNFFAILVAALVFRFEKLTLRKIGGCIVGFSGILIILGGVQALISGGAVSMAGEGAMIISTLFYATSGCMIKLYSKQEDPVVLSGYQFVLGGAVLFIIGKIMGGQLIFYTTSCIYLLIYMGFISAGAYTMWSILLKYNPVSRVSILGFMNPVLGVLLSAIFLNEGNEAFSINGVLALLLVSAGIIIVNTEKKKDS